MGTLQIDVLGTSFSIKASENTDYLQKLLGYYKRITEEIEKNGSLKDPLQISAMAGIVLCDELYKEKGKIAKLKEHTKKNNTEEEVDRITSELISKIDKVL